MIGNAFEQARHGTVVQTENCCASHDADSGRPGGRNCGQAFHVVAVVQIVPTRFTVLLHQEDIQEGIENAPETFLRLFTGQNLGKQLLKLADPIDL